MARRVALCVLAVAALACGSEPPQLPAELIGTWRTQSPDLRESYFELREGWVVFGADRYRISMHPIHSIESTRSGTATAYAIEYLTEDGAALPLQLVYSPGTPPRLQIGRRRDAWFPESKASSTAKEAS